MIALLLTRYQLQQKYLHQLVDDLTEEEMIAQPKPGMNHAAWIVGHLAWTSNSLVSMLGGTSEYDRSWNALFDFHSFPRADATLYPSKPDLLASFDAAHRHVAMRVSRVTDDQLSQILPVESLRSLIPTVGDAIVHITTTHEATHIGQLSAWRRALGREPAPMLAFASHSD